MKFNEFSLDSRLLEGIEAIGFEDTTPVQEKAIPPIMAGKDIVASAQTGTGKTAAFLLPIIHKILQAPHDDHIKALVIVPTRELANQIDQQMEGLSYFTSVSSIAVFGGGDGNSFTREKQALSQGADVVIGTPGRLIAHLNMGYVKISYLKYFILDEADRMLDMGFYDDIMRIISFLPSKRQNLMFSATMPKKIREMANKVLINPEEISIAISKPAERVVQAAFVVYDHQKNPLVKFLLQAKALRSVLIFCSTKISTKQLYKELKQTTLKCGEIHSDLEQVDREKVLASFKNRQINVLVATDILSRGIDIEDIDLVINYDVPHDGEDYIHRIGRTARAASKGLAITLINEKDQNRFSRIESMLGSPIQKGKTPPSLGETPIYNPRSSGSYGKKRFSKKRK